ncbi:M23 family metallopeptidase [Leucobacter massiliensis]|uniref:M23ase beta-sheet core domain-containing protein n=1 Tax=Leucobacter massiliensis TaxID=1686285 RepID=A0A2S9QLQ1_9MICO|nr:M23 family metallopeptidase [Leucobacter massiliensis]PRI10526.1 hypothetical protein B4915_11010 [Leucobacter massiliensis]
MSAPALLACAAAAMCLALPVIAASAQLEAHQRAAAAADAAALAAADALTGWSAGPPCALAQEVAAAVGTRLLVCSTREELAEARVEVSASGPFGAASGEARAGAPMTDAARSAASGAVGPDGWAWPSDRRAVTQGPHDGWALDLAVSPEGALYAPYAGVVISAGPDGFGVPEACRVHPEWWRGPNVTVVMRHEYRGRVLYSSHNHVMPASPQSFGIAPGSRVRAGQRVATAGMSGCTSGPHTHFTLATTPRNTAPDLDPFAYLGPP